MREDISSETGKYEHPPVFSVYVHELAPGNVFSSVFLSPTSGVKLIFFYFRTVRQSRAFQTFFIVFAQEGLDAEGSVPYMMENN